MKLCTSCIYYENKINYCNHFKFKANSISSASICCKFTESKKTKSNQITTSSINSTQADTLINT